MRTYHVDTNVFLRFLVGDDTQKAQRAKAWFEKAKRDEVHLVVDRFVLLETLITLRNYYKLPKHSVCDHIASILNAFYLDIEAREMLTHALDIYRHHGIDFIDAFLLVRAHDSNQKILSFDKDFDDLARDIREKP